MIIGQFGIFSEALVKTRTERFVLVLADKTAQEVGHRLGKEEGDPRKAKRISEGYSWLVISVDNDLGVGYRSANERSKEQDRTSRGYYYYYYYYSVIGEELTPQFWPSI